MSLEITGLCVGYDSDIIRDISLTVSPGTIVTIIGPNGSGKSTLLKTVTGQLKDRGGVIFLDGSDRSAMSTKEIASKLSMVMTTQVRPELMTCQNVIESGRYPYTGLFGKLTDEDRAKVDEAMDITDTRHLADRLFTNISDGQRQRVLLARSIAQEPDVLVLDEPTSYLDIRYKIDILLKIKTLAVKKNIAVLMSIHEPEIAMRVSDTVVAVGAGAVRRLGTPSEVFDEVFIRSLYELGDADPLILGQKPWFDEADRAHLPWSDEPDKNHMPGIDAAGPVRSSKCACIMIQGTMSNVGKSVIAAGLCRIFARAGYRVAPFKSQNMALNSYVTDDGLEMGRAQVVQAECAKTSPKVCMNPVLLKPVSDCGSQVIVNGRVVGNMPAVQYYEYKKTLKPVIMQAFEELSGDNDIIVIEGAGSPAEINLKSDDIVNMGLAEMLDVPVLLVGDIDRGGVFAQLLGTLDLLDASERERVKGLIVNKFRGDVSLLKPGLDELKRRSGCPVTGVIPYTDIRLDDEDSLSERLHRRDAAKIDIAVIRLPHISNFTDMNVFEQCPGVSVRYVDDPAGLGSPDILILPGTKNTIGDMNWLTSTNLSQPVRDLCDKGCIIIGICGGYQMLGRMISDPEGMESGGSTQGLSLLPVDTVLKGKKTRKMFKGRITSPSGALADLAGCECTGYEIHAGQTGPYGECSGFTSDGTGYCCGNVYGSYVHGLFDRADVCRGLIRAAAKRSSKDIDTDMIVDQARYRDAQYERLADILEENLDMDMIYSVMGIDAGTVMPGQNGLYNEGAEHDN